MDEFIVGGKTGFVRISVSEVYDYPDRLSPFGGYDVKGYIEIKSGNYHVLGGLWFTTAEVYEFFEALQRNMDTLSGEALFETYESNLELSVIFKSLGHIRIKGRYIEVSSTENELIFGFDSDQSYMFSTLTELRRFVEKYGNKQGLK